MSKISKSRYVGISEQDLEEFTCGICLDILVNPVVTKCCRQTYCSQCINQWLIDNKYCPLDRRSLTEKGITPASRAIYNLLNNMKIKCYFQSNGCEKVIPRHELSEHEKCCQFSKCKTCGFTIGLDNKHKCIENLLIQIESINDENKQLLNENSELKKKNENLNKDNSVLLESNEKLEIKCLSNNGLKYENLKLKKKIKQLTNVSIISSTNSQSNTSMNNNNTIDSKTNESTVSKQTFNRMFQFNQMRARFTLRKSFKQKPINSDTNNNFNRNQFNPGITSNPTTDQTNSSKLFGKTKSTGLSSNQSSTGEEPTVGQTPFTSSIPPFDGSIISSDSVPQILTQPPIPPFPFNFSPQISFDFGARPEPHVFKFSAENSQLDDKNIK